MKNIEGVVISSKVLILSRYLIKLFFLSIPTYRISAMKPIQFLQFDARSIWDRKVVAKKYFPLIIAIALVKILSLLYSKLVSINFHFCSILFMLLVNIYSRLYTILFNYKKKKDSI